MDIQILTQHKNGYLSGILLKLEEDLINGLLRGEHDEELELLQLDVERIVVLAEEDLEVLAEETLVALTDKLEVAEGHVLDLGLLGEQRDERRAELLEKLLGLLLVGLGDDVNVEHDDLARGEND